MMTWASRLARLFVSRLHQSVLSALVVSQYGCPGSLGLLAVADFRQHACDEAKQLVERVESYCRVRCNVFDSALEPPSINIRFRSKLDNEGRVELPSTHQEQTIVRPAL